MRRLLCLAVALSLFTSVATVFAADEDTAKAAATRKLLQKKIPNLNFKDTPLRDALDEIKGEVKGLFFLPDTAGGVSLNQKVNYTGKDVTVAQALDGMLGKLALGYYVISQQGNARDGFVRIVKGNERGYPKDKAPKDK
jgi:hypothetical protein